MVFAAVLTWAVMTLFVSYHRSFWGDEFVRIGQMQSGFIESVVAILREPSPFNPGEIVLDWVSKLSLAGLGVPAEVWGRVPGIAWGAATLYIAFELARANKVFRFVPLFVAFSAPLVSFAAEMRPYASLFYSGALCFQILWQRGLHTKTSRFGAWAVVLFGHIYGICFVLFSLAVSSLPQQWRTRLKSEWVKVIVGTAIVLIALLQPKLDLTSQSNAIYPSFWAIARQIGGILTNPHKASYVICPLALLGIIYLARVFPRRALDTLILLGASILGPLLATIASHYFFVPRHVVGGAFSFLALASVGLSWLTLKFIPDYIAWAIAAFVSIVPWTMAILLHIPPFPNQPLHRFREVAREIYEKKLKTVAVLDVCNAHILQHYMTKLQGQAPQLSPPVQISGEAAEKSCWPDGTCFYSLKESKYCSIGPDVYDYEGGTLAGVLSSMKFDAVIHYFERAPKTSPRQKPPLFIRDWY